MNFQKWELFSGSPGTHSITRTIIEYNAAASNTMSIQFQALKQQALKPLVDTKILFENSLRFTVNYFKLLRLVLNTFQFRQDLRKTRTEPCYVDIINDGWVLPGITDKIGRSCTLNNFFENEFKSYQVPFLPNR